MMREIFKGFKEALKEALKKALRKALKDAQRVKTNTYRKEH